MDWPRALFSLLNGVVPVLGVVAISERRVQDSLKYCLIVAVMGAVSYFAYGLPGFKASPYETLASYSSFILSHTLIFRKNIFTSIALIAIPVPLYLAIELIAFLIFRYVLGVQMEGINLSYLQLSGMLGLECLIWLGIIFTVPLYKWVQRRWEYLENASIIYINVICVVFYTKMVQTGGVNNPKDPAVSNMLILLFVVAGCCNLLLLLYLRRNIKQQAEIKRFQGLQEIAIPLIKELRSKQHDYKNHLQALSCIAEQQSQPLQPVMAYIQELSRDADEHAEFLKTENPILGALLHIKKGIAQQKGIRFRATGELSNVSYPIKEYEMVSMLGNLLDNALEATSAGGEILLHMGKDESGSYILVENTCAAVDTSQLFKWGTSTKGTGRGMGLSNVKKIVSNYNGTISVELEKGNIRFRISFVSIA